MLSRPRIQYLDSVTDIVDIDSNEVGHLISSQLSLDGIAHNMLRELFSPGGGSGGDNCVAQTHHQQHEIEASHSSPNCADRLTSIYNKRIAEFQDLNNYLRYRLECLDYQKDAANLDIDLSAGAENGVAGGDAAMTLANADDDVANFAVASAGLEDTPSERPTKSANKSIMMMSQRKVATTKRKNPFIKSKYSQQKGKLSAAATSHHHHPQYHHPQYSQQPQSHQPNRRLHNHHRHDDEFPDNEEECFDAPLPKHQKKKISILQQQQRQLQTTGMMMMMTSSSGGGNVSASRSGSAANHSAGFTQKRKKPSLHPLNQQQRSISGSSKYLQANSAASSAAYSTETLHKAGVKRKKLMMISQQHTQQQKQSHTIRPAHPPGKKHPKLSANSKRFESAANSSRGALSLANQIRKSSAKQQQQQQVERGGARKMTSSSATATSSKMTQRQNVMQSAAIGGAGRRKERAPDFRYLHGNSNANEDDEDEDEEKNPEIDDEEDLDDEEDREEEAEREEQQDDVEADDSDYDDDDNNDDEDDDDDDADDAEHYERTTMTQHHRGYAEDYDEEENDEDDDDDGADEQDDDDDDDDDDVSAPSDNNTKERRLDRPGVEMAKLHHHSHHHAKRGGGGGASNTKLKQRKRVGGAAANSPANYSSSDENSPDEIPIKSSQKSYSKASKANKGGSNSHTYYQQSGSHQNMRYCICNRKSFGDMVACDNRLCIHEWFHFACVGLTCKPKGKWYCPKCRGDKTNVPKKPQV